MSTRNKSSYISMCFYFMIILPKLSISSRILAIFPVAAKSHFTMGAAIAKSLHDVGHHITLVSPFPWNETSTNYTILDSRFDSPIFEGENEIDLDIMMQHTVHSLTQFLTLIEEKRCYDIINIPQIQDALSMVDSKPYDILIMELFFMFECYLPIAEKLDIPVIGTVTTKTWKPAEYTVGVPNEIASIPLEMIDLSAEMTFFERLKNVVYNIIFAYNYIHVVANRVERFRKQYFTEEFPDKKISLLFTNSHSALLSRSLPPNVIEIGGIHIAPAQALSEDLKRFIDEAEHGVILFSLGSLAKGSSMPASAKSAFITAFATLPQRIIWKFDKSLESFSENVLIRKWVPQRDILEHENVRAFISHCGQNSAFEAIHTGTPLVAIPLFTDQYTTAAMLQARGVALRLNIHTITSEQIIRSLNAVINDTRYIQRMQDLRQIFNDRPMSPQQAVIYWTEYVLRHQGALHLQTNASDLPLHQYLILDVIAFLVFIVIAIVFLTLMIGKILLRIVYSISPQRFPDRKNKNKQS